MKDCKFWSECKYVSSRWNMCSSPCLVSDIGTKVPADNAVPGGVVPAKGHQLPNKQVQRCFSYFLSNSFLM